jgi:hypothetical protein
MEDVNISKFRAQVVRAGSTPASPGFVVSEGQNPVDPSGSGQNHLPVTIGSPANGLAVTDAQILTIDKAQIFAGTSSQFVKGDGTLDSTAYGTGTVTSVALTMPTAFSVANSPVTTAGTLAVTATGTTSQYIRGDGSLETFPSLTGFVPYTGATADVNLGTFDLLAERGTFENNGSSNTLTVNHTSGSGYGIIVTKGGNNEALYVSKTSGSGNAMTVVGGRTSLVDLALSSVTNTAGDFLTLSGGVVHKRTAAQTLIDIGGQAALTNPVTGTGASGQVAYFTGTSAISSESNLFWDAANDRLGVGTNTPSAKLEVNGTISLLGDIAQTGNFVLTNRNFELFLQTDAAKDIIFRPATVEGMRIFSGGNVHIGTTPASNAGFKLDVNGNARFSSGITTTTTRFNNTNGPENFILLNDGNVAFGAALGLGSSGDFVLSSIASSTLTERFRIARTGGAATFSSNISINNSGTTIANIGSTSSQGGLDLYSGATVDYNGGALITLVSSDRSGAYTRGELYISAGRATNNTANGFIEFATSATPRMRITSGGNVGIGTTSPDALLEVENASNPSIFVTNTGAATLRLQAATGVVYVGSKTSDSLDFITTDAPRMRITSGGNFGIANNGFSNTRVTITGSDNGSSNFGLVVNNSSNGNLFLVRNDGQVTVANLGTGTVTSTAGVLSSVSDSSYKIEDGFIDSAIEKVLSLKPRYFYWNKKSGLPTDKRQLGFYAQEVNQALGEEAANTPQNENTSWGITDRSMIAMLTKAIQELKQEIDTLKN